MVTGTMNSMPARFPLKFSVVVIAVVSTAESSLPGMATEPVHGVTVNVDASAVPVRPAT
jgi:hypothetical protein